MLQLHFTKANKTVKYTASQTNINCRSMDTDLHVGTLHSINSLHKPVSPCKNNASYQQHQQTPVFM